MVSLKQFGASRPARLIGKKMARANLVAASITLGVSSVLLTAFQFVALRGDLVDNLQAQARIVGANSASALLAGDARGAAGVLATLSGAPGIASALMLNQSGQPLARYAAAGAAALPPAAAVAPAGRWDGPAAGLAAPRVSRHAGYVDVAEAVAPPQPASAAAAVAAATAPAAPLGAVVLRASMAPVYRQLGSYAAVTLAIALGAFGMAWLRVRGTRRAAQRAEAHLHYLAHVDPVTALPNRHEFNATLAHALHRADRQESSVGLLLLDLDNFKLVNDTLGHNAGDALLRMVAQRLTAILRANDVVCRIGGDEFVVIVEPADETLEPASVARKILAELARPFTLDSHQLYVSASIGVSLYPADATDAQSLTRTADTAMYQAKQDGKNRHAVFQPQMELRAQKRLRLEASLRRAMADGQLELYYQPQVALASGRLVGMEVLTRWHCPELGVVDPAEFIPVAEESGVIVALGRWVLQGACRQAAAWRAAGLLDQVENIAVNLSASQARDAGLPEQIGAILAETALPAGLLELELTESILMDDAEASLQLMQRFRDAGLRLSIDDFGTGYSSMSYLQRFPIDKLKIDRSFIGNVPGDGAAIATAIIAMAHSLQMTVVAEGVETVGQADFLRRAGCDAVQGYLYGRPMPAAKFGALLRERRVWQSTATTAPTQAAALSAVL